MTKRKSTNNDPQNVTHKTKDRVTRTPLKTGGELNCSGMASGSCSTSDTCRVTLVTNTGFQAGPYFPNFPYFFYSSPNIPY